MSSLCSRSNLSTRVMLAETHAFLRRGLSDRIDREPDLSVVGEAGNAEQAIRLAHRRRADVILLDTDMPGLSCFEAARRIRNRKTPPAIVFLAGDLNDTHLQLALSVGADGFLTKHASLRELLRAIRAVHGGKRFFSPLVRERLMFDRGRPLMVKNAKPARLYSLAAIEIELIRLIGQGYTVEKCADLLKVGHKTADKWKTRLMKKLNIHDRVKIARYAIRKGLIRA